MTRVDRQLLTCALALGSIGLGYFAGVALGVPEWGIVALVIAVFLCYRLPFKHIPETPDHATWLQGAALLAGAALIVNRSYYLAELHGGWDAWAMWNYKSRAMTDGEHWSVFLRNRKFSHSDYPLMLPGINAFFMRLAGPRGYEIIPYLTAFSVTLLAPLWLYSRLAVRHTGVAILALLLFATDDTYLTLGLLQYADGLLGFFFLAVLLSADAALAPDAPLRTARHTGFFLGCCLWTKNEGCLLALLFLALYAPAFWKARRLLAVGQGLLLPVTVWMAFKIGWPQPNDLLDAAPAAKPGEEAVRLIATSLKVLLDGPFGWLQALVWTVGIVCLVRRRWPQRAFVLCLLCLLGMNAVYLLTPYDLQWHLDTSQNRLVFQLLPAFAYSGIASMLRATDATPAGQTRATTGFAPFPGLR